MCNKTLSKKYYVGICNTLKVYIIAKICCLLFQKSYLKMQIGIKNGLFSVLGISGVDYSWYVEMYIGLFLLIPFLNILYRGIDSQKKKIVFIITLLICTTVPTIFNIFDWNTIGFWRQPSISTEYQMLFPDWWLNIYPLTYYFIGAYLREYDLKISIRRNLLLLVFGVVLFSTFNYYRSYNGTFEWGIYNDWGGFENVIDSVLLFVVLLHIKTEKIPMGIKSMIVKISELSFGVYLLSYIADQIIYPRFNSYVPIMTNRLEWYFVIVPLVFVISIAMSQIVNVVCNGIEKLIVRKNK